MTGSVLNFDHGLDKVSIFGFGWVMFCVRPTRTDSLWSEQLCELTDEEVDKIEANEAFFFNWEAYSALWGVDLFPKESKKSSIMLKIKDLDVPRVRLLKRCAHICSLAPVYSLFWVSSCL